MRFGLAPQEKERRAQARRNYLCDWHTWFAWYPIRVYDVGWIWLEPVLRKQDIVYCPWGHSWIDVGARYIACKNLGK